MPALRGLLASLGTSVSLAAAGALALLAISAVVALEGWPGLGVDAEGRTLSIGDLTVPRSEPTEQGNDGPVMLAAAPEEEAPAPAAAPAADDDPPPVADDPAPAGATDPAASPPRTPAPGAAPTPAPPAPVPAPRPGRDDDSLLDVDLGVEEPVRGLTGLTGDVLRGTGETLSPATDALLPGSGGLVEGVTDDLGNTVENTGGALGATLDLLLTGR